MKIFSYIICAFVLTIFLIGSVSAMEIDNWKNYNEVNKEVTITNAFGLGSELATIKLVSNTYSCLENCEADITLILKEDYLGALKELKFYKYYGAKMTETNLDDYEVLVRTGSYIEEQHYETRTCEDREKEIGCVTEKKIREVTRYTYEPFDDADLKAGTYYIKIKGKKNKNETIEWIPTFLGKEIDE